MTTRRRDAERRQVSLTVEILEDRFLLSGAASPPAPAAPTGPAAAPVAAPPLATTREALSVSPQEAPGRTAATPILGLPSYAINAQEDVDDNDDPPGMTDKDAVRNGALGFPLPNCAYNNVAGNRDFTLPARALGQMALPTANPMPFLPLLSASGMGALRTVPFAPAAPTAAAAGEAPGNYGPVPDHEEIQPSPASPQASPSFAPPPAEERTDRPRTSSSRPFAEVLAIDLEAIQRRVDAIFQRLGDLSEEWHTSRVFEKLAPWLLAASLTGYGWVRLRSQKDRGLADLLRSDWPQTVLSIFLAGGEG